AGTRDVVDEAALADEQGAVLKARNTRSDQSTHVLDRASRLAARAFVIISSRERRLVRHRLGGFADRMAYASASKASSLSALTGLDSKVSFSASARKAGSLVGRSKAGIHAGLRSAGMAGGAANGRAMGSARSASISGFDVLALLQSGIVSGANG